MKTSKQQITRRGLLRSTVSGVVGGSIGGGIVLAGSKPKQASANYTNWISVEDDLPPVSMTVLVCGVMEHFNICPAIWPAHRFQWLLYGYRHPDYNLSEPPWYWIGLHDRQVKEVKYWAYVNKPPCRCPTGWFPEDAAEWQRRHNEV